MSRKDILMKLLCVCVCKIHKHSLAVLLRLLENKLMAYP